MIIEYILNLVQYGLKFFGFTDQMFIKQIKFFSPDTPFTLTENVMYNTYLDHENIMKSDDSLPYEYLNCTYYFNNEQYCAIYTKKLIWNTISNKNIIKPTGFSTPIPLITKAVLYNEDKTKKLDISSIVRKYIGPYGDYYFNSKTITDPSMLSILRANNLSTKIWCHLQIEDSFFNKHEISFDTPEYKMSFYKFLTKND